MRNVSLALFLVIVILVGLVQVSTTQGQKAKKGKAAPKVEVGAADTTKQDEALLRKKNLPTDEAGLLKYFKDRTFSEADPKQLAVLIKHLGSEDFRKREKAFRKIQDFGSGAIFSLKKAHDVEDAEVRTRIGQILQQIEEEADPRVQAAVARLIADRKPKGAVRVLLDYLPFADDSVVEEIRHTLTSLAATDGKADPALAAALASALPLQRRVAAEALVRGDAKDQIPAVRKLLEDEDALVRLRVALALAEKNEIDAVATMIDTLKELAPEQLWPAENILVRLAGKDTPEVSLGTNEADRQKAWQAWHEWWTKQDRQAMAKRLAALDRLDEYKGFIQVVYQTNQQIVGGVVRQQGREVLELGLEKDIKKPLWSFTITNTFPVDMQIIGKDRLLLTEYTGRRISIRDFDGRILKEHFLPTFPISANQLPNGNIFVAMRNQLVEFDRSWKQVWSYSGAGSNIFRASKLHDGTVVFVTNSGDLCFLDSKQNQLIRSFNVGQVGTFYGGLEVLPNGNVIVPRYSNHQVVEYDRNGNVVWQANVQWPTSTARLPNGNTLVGSMNTRRLVEINRQGQEMWFRNLPGQIYRVRVR